MEQEHQTLGSDLRGAAARPKSSMPLLVLVYGLCGVLLYFAQAVFIPIALAVLGAVLAMVGPGAWSIDARLFGRKHINISDR